MNNDSVYGELNPENNQKTKIRKRVKKPSAKYGDFFEWLDVVAVALICVIIVFSFVFKIVKISGESMLNTLHSGEMVILTDFSYKPKTGDIVVISRNVENIAETITASQGPIIKRVIATENQRVKIENGKVYINGAPLAEDYLTYDYTNSGDLEGEVMVPKGHIFVLGDNRPNSHDSRSHNIGENGMVDTRYVLGHAVYRIFPFEKIGSLKK